MGLVGLKLEKMDMLGNAIKDLKDISIDNYLLNTYYQQSSSGQRGVGWGQWEEGIAGTIIKDTCCLLYTSDAADELRGV